MSGVTGEAAWPLSAAASDAGDDGALVDVVGLATVVGHSSVVGHSNVALGMAGRLMEAAISAEVVTSAGLAQLVLQAAPINFNSSARSNGLPSEKRTKKQHKWHA